MATAKNRTAGRKKGTKNKSDIVVLNRFSLNFYTTIKNEKGDVIGRDYRIHRKHVSKLMRDFSRAIDTQTVKFLKGVRAATHKEDIIKYVPNLIVLTECDPTDYPVGTFYPEDELPDFMTNKEATLQEIEDRFKSICLKLENEGRSEILAGLHQRWDRLKTCDKPPTKPRDPREIEDKQLNAFSW